MPCLVPNFAVVIWLGITALVLLALQVLARRKLRFVHQLQVFSTTCETDAASRCIQIVACSLIIPILSNLYFVDGLRL